MVTSRSQALAEIGLCASLGIALHFVEGCFPPPLPLPGVKVGLANVATLVALFLWGEKEALFVVVLRVVLGNLLSGTLFGVSFFLSLGGGLSSLAVMSFVRKHVSSPLWASMGGALSHNLGQWVVALLYIQSRELLWYLPFLLGLSVPSGVFVGYLGTLIMRSRVLKQERSDQKAAQRSTTID
ncbi:MAG: Gx transporter family protein [Candidatus Caldatribacteriaceae bacterium]